jgi:hypothetical protein
VSETNWREVADALAKAIEDAYQSGGELTPAAGHALFAYHKAGLWVPAREGV